MKQRKLLLTLSGGGFMWQSKSVLKTLNGPFKYHYITEAGTLLPAAQEIPDGEAFEVPHATTLAEQKLSQRLWSAMKCLIATAWVLARVRPDVVIAVGTSMSLFVCLWGRFFGARTIFIESITRVNSLSSTGRLIVSWRLADRVYVQWPGLADVKRGVYFEGTVV